MKKLMQELYTRLTTGESVVMVTVVTRSGSAPRGAGARMLVGTEGRVRGTIGGGAVEHEAEGIALKALAEGKCVLREFSLSSDGIADIGMVCGGAVTLYFQYYGGGDIHAAEPAAEIIRLLDEGKAAWLVITLTGKDSGRMEVVSPKSDPDKCARLDALPKGRTLFEDAGGQTCYAELLAGGGTIYVFGGGHVAQELVPLLAHIGFRCVVLDDRAQFASQTLFPDAYQVILTEFDGILHHIDLTAADYAVVMTRGHQHDLTIQRQLLTTDVGYIGVMGSQKKKEYVFSKLRESGFTDHDLARVVTPIGLAIGAETPAEVAVSIVAQLIQTRTVRQ